jgi:hypothetical protein
LPYVRHQISLSLSLEENDGAVVEEIQGLATAIRGHPMISEFSSQMKFSFANLGSLCSALATLPSLGRVEFGLMEPEAQGPNILANLEPLTELLRAPALRVVEFAGFYFTNELCHATANALEEGSSIIDIIFINAPFPTEGEL